MANDSHIVSAPIESPEHAATPAAPVAGTMLLYPKTDEKWYQQTPAGVETVLGGGGGSAEAETFAFFLS